MIRFFYDLALFTLLVSFFPKLLIDFFFKNKYRKSLKKRLNPQIDKKGAKEVIWLHAVSMGETKALSTLVPHIRRSYPDAFIFVTIVTETGHEQAKKSISDADAIHYLPLDFSWVIRSFVKALQPRLLILVEGDYWLNLMSEVKKCGGRIVVVSGKLSEKSMKRYLLFRPLNRLLFSSVDHFYLQGESYLERFLNLGISPDKLTVTGNLKFDIPSTEPTSLEEFKKSLNILPQDRVITLGSTHDGEENLLLTALLPFLENDPYLKVLVVPRHPERFKKVKENIRHPQIIVVDQMGVLPKCYCLSFLAIVGGSFIRGVGGHDIFEPTKMGVPTLFGPYMDNQVDFDRELTQAGAALKVIPQDLGSAVEKLLNEPKLHLEMSKRGTSFAQKNLGVSLRTWDLLKASFSN
ncbi:MAG: 3-deoxy-D-manno-octulosonic acid transferase [Chlamydiia bacterium]|nr:3-deoxy-D-manno-octulosonic acid transferase [Chlamydiia bacterium]